MGGSGAVIFAGGSQELNGSYSLADLNVNGSNVTLNIPVTVTAFNLATGTVTANSPLNVDGQFTWDGGTLAGSSVTNANGGILIDQNQVVLSGTTLNNAAGQVATLAGGASLGFFNGAVFNNAGT